MRWIGVMGIGLSMVATNMGREVQACINDRDTLASEARAVPDAMGAISGRFERNPPLYYQVRLARVMSELKITPARLDLYDDAAVACDRLGQHDRAITLIEAKRAQLEKLDATQPDVREQWYRYFANCGTFWAHRWIARGANRGNIGEMKRGRDLIARAIQIKPDAHFGREKYQLQLMQWIIAPPKIAKNETAPDFLGLSKDSSHSLSEVDLQKKGYGDAVRGLSGLIMLGNAWQSIDVYNALRQTMRYGDRNSMISLTTLRLKELARNGKRSLHPQMPVGKKLVTTLGANDINPFSADPSRVEADYTKLRAEADQWHQRRDSYMTQRLEVGRHPDTDAAFWNEWVDPGPPSLEPPTNWSKILSDWSPYAILLSVLPVSWWILKRKRRTKIRAA